MENQAYGASFFNEIYPIDSNTSIIVNYGNGAIDALSTESLANVLHGSESAALQRYMRQRGYITELTKEQEIEVKNNICINVRGKNDFCYHAIIRFLTKITPPVIQN